MWKKIVVIISCIIPSPCIGMQHTKQKSQAVNSELTQTENKPNYYYCINDNQGNCALEIETDIDFNLYRPLRNATCRQLLLAWHPRCGRSSWISGILPHLARYIAELTTMMHLSKEQQEKALVYALIQNASEEIKLFIECGVDVECRAVSMTFSPLSVAASQCSATNISMLLLAGAQVKKNNIRECYDKYCRKMLFTAYKQKNALGARRLKLWEILERDDDKRLNKMIAKGLSPDFRIHRSYPIIFAAVHLKKSAVLKALINAGANVNASAEWWFPYKNVLLVAEHYAPEYVSLIREQLQERTKQ